MGRGMATVDRCMATQVFRYTFGRRAAEDATDACTLEQLDDARTEHDGSIRELLVGMTISDGFRYRIAAPIEEE